MNAQTTIEAAPPFAASLVAALAEIEGATKDKVNPAFKSKYADLTSVIEAIRPVLARHNLAFTQHPEPSDKGVCIETVLHHAGGDTLSLGKLYVPANKQDAQGFGSALTYARRYALVTAFGVPVEDDDGNAASRAQQYSGQDNAGEMQGEPARKPRQKLDGPYTSPTQLKTAIKEFVHTMNGCGDWDEWLHFRDTKDAKELIEQVQRDMPAWWEGSPDMPPEFVPLHRQIELFEANIARQFADIARA